MTAMNAVTHKRIEAYLARPAHALLLWGSDLADSRQTAQYIIDKLSTLPPITVEPEQGKNSISIEQIRNLRQQLRTKRAAQETQIVVIAPADTLLTEAQNAFLKLLEEPPAGIYFILLTNDCDRMLPTIRSRAVSISVLPLSLHEALQVYGDTPEVRKAHALSGGKPSLLTSLLHDEKHPFAAHIQTAKNIIASDVFERLSLIESSFKDREALSNLLEALYRVSRAAMQAQPQQKRWQHITTCVLEAKTQLQSQLSPKLVAMNLFMQL